MDNKFIYKTYEISEDNEKIYLKYFFEIENLSEFVTKYEIMKKDFKWKHLKSNTFKNLVFNLGMVEAISYYKVTCSKIFEVKAGFLDDEQKLWYRKLFYNGLGEFRYKNNISTKEENFVEFISSGEKLELEDFLENSESEKVIVPVGGGKDSNVTLELLKGKFKNIIPFLINGKENSYECIKIAGFEKNEIIEVNRILDKNIIDLNNKGYLNGHTPFSAMVAFLTYLISFLLDVRYIALSNENSANETNVEGENINHQYSKSLEFENDFRFYYKKYLKAGDVEYFSFLRPISELQIALLFSRFEKYHRAFKSCNVGSKQKPWVWCCNCPKCLFVYTILSPFIKQEKLENIFGENLFEKEGLKEIFIELCGFGEIKPFECVGTYSEVRYSVSKVINDYLKENKTLPFLLKYYYENYELEDLNSNVLKNYSEENNLPKKFEEILKESL